MVKMISRSKYMLGVIGILCASIFSIVPVGASTAFPGRNGKIAFSKTVAGTPSIWVMNADGTAQRRLAPQAHSPVWSPDGSKIAFVCNDRLCIMNADGSGRQNLTTQPGYKENSPVWSRDGSRVAFVRETTAPRGAWPQSAIISMNLNEHSETNISGWGFNKGYRAPSWSPDASEIVYEQYDRGKNSSRLLIKNIAHGLIRELTTLSWVTGPSDASWSPNGKKILYNDSYGQVYTIWPDGSHRTVISDGDSYGASWSPSGTQIAFLEDFSGETVSLSEKDGTVVWIPINKGTYEQIGFPSWSPSGTKLIFTMHRTVDGKPITDLVLLDLKDERHTLSLLAQGDISELNWQAKESFNHAD